MDSLSSRALALLIDGWRSGSTAVRPPPDSRTPPRTSRTPIPRTAGPHAGPQPPAYAALADRISLLILDGRIPLGARVPAERDIAAQLGISRTTVSAAYTHLREAGFLLTTQGSGSVARLPAEAGRPHTMPPGAHPHATLLDFSKATIPAPPALATAAAWAADQLPSYLGGSGFDPIGLPVLRRTLADRYTARGLPTTDDQIMVTIGAQHAIALVARTLLSRGDRALVESPSYPHAFEALRSAGARLVPVNVTTDDGWDEQGFEQAIQRTSPSLGYLMPDFHNPTGQSMRPEFREKALALAAHHGTVLVADETMAELGLDDANPSLPFAAYGDGGVSGNRPSAPSSGQPPVVLIGSVGKTVWGGVRIGWIRADRPIIQRLVRARAAGDLGTPILEQLVVTHLLGDYDAILASRRSQLRGGRDYLVRLLAEQIPDWRVPHVPGGLTAWVNLGSPVSSQLTLAARSEGLQIAAGPLFGIDGAFDRFLRIPFSYSEAEIDRAVGALAAAWAAVGRYPVAERSSLAEVV